MNNQGTAATLAGIAIGVGYSVESAFRTWGSGAAPTVTEPRKRREQTCYPDRSSGHRWVCTYPNLIM